MDHTVTSLKNDSKRNHATTNLQQWVPLYRVTHANGKTSNWLPLTLNLHLSLCKFCKICKLFQSNLSHRNVLSNCEDPLGQKLSGASGKHPGPEGISKTLSLKPWNWLDENRRTEINVTPQVQWPHLHFSVAKMAGCLRGEQHVGAKAENNGHLSESISMIMKCVLGSPWEESADTAALHGEFCHRMKEVGGKTWRNIRASHLLYPL